MRNLPGRDCGPKDSTGGDNKNAGSTSGDTRGPFWPSSCRRASSLGSRLSPGVEFGWRAVAGASVCAGRPSRLDGRRQLGTRPDRRRHEGAVLAVFLSPGVESGWRAVAGRRVWVAGCRLGVSLRGTAKQTRRSATTESQTRLAATTRNQTRPAATRGARFGRLPVAGRRVWAVSCRRASILGSRLSPAVENGQLPVAGASACTASARTKRGTPTQGERAPAHPDIAPSRYDCWNSHSITAMQR